MQKRILLALPGVFLCLTSSHAAPIDRFGQVTGIAIQCSVPDPNNPASVEVKARPEAVKKGAVWNDCGKISDDQFLEAGVPVQQKPMPRDKDRPFRSLEANGSLPLRRKLCGAVRRYGVLNENNDPRDIMIDIFPAKEFEHFVAGFVNTEMTPLEREKRELVKFGSGMWDGRKWVPGTCKEDACLIAAKDRKHKTVHCEITPAEQFYGQDGRFMPIMSAHACSDDWRCRSELEPANQPSHTPSAFKAWPNGKDVCVYGVYALDHGSDHGGPGSSGAHTTRCCSKDNTHDRPEIHPFDAIWFRHPERDGWIFGVFQDDSNRYSSPDCSRSNFNEWSQSPRDLTFRFPITFRRSAAPKVACLRHIRTRKVKLESIGGPLFKNVLGAAHTIVPLNVTTKAQPSPVPETKEMKDGNVKVLSIVEPASFEDEAQVSIDGSCVSGGNVTAWVTVRVAIGCDTRAGKKCTEAQLKGFNRLGKHDAGDSGSGFYYAELTLENGNTCQP